MKKVLLIACLTMFFGVVKAQEETTYTDEELTKYATVMVWGELEKKKMTGIYNGWINQDEVLEPKRFSEIRKTKGDSLKLQEIEVSDVEFAAYNTIQSKYDSMISSFTVNFKAEIKEKVGYGLYNKLKKAVKSEDEVKSRYQTIYDGVLEEQKANEDESED